MRVLYAVSNAVKKGAFTGDADADDDGDFCGRILYPQCRSSVYTPSNWDPALIERSCSIPDAQLKLDFVYGYAGKAASVGGGNPPVCVLGLSLFQILFDSPMDLHLVMGIST